MEEQQATWLIKFAAILGVVGVLGSLPFGLSFALSVALGAALGVGNLIIVRRSVRRMINATVSGGRVASNFFIKFGVLAAVIGLSFRFLPIQPLGFMLGFGVLVISLVIGPFLGPDPHSDAKAQDGETAAGAE